jgi:1-acyl-sn-glycerol-3-phosphate acyltransferase
MIRKGMRSEVFFLLGILFLLVLFRRERRKLISPSPSVGEWGWLGPEPLFDTPSADKVLSPSLPRRGNWLTRAIGRLVYTLLGWRIEGQLPDVPKLVIIGAPHTSYWDAPLAVGFFLATGLDCRWMAKKESFAHPLGDLMRWMGAIPVDRQAPGDLVQQVIDEMNRSEKFVLVITPEGTRKKVERWKTGFYRIALATGTPITLAYADFGQRVAGIGPTIRPTGDVETQIEEMRAYYREITARNPEWA